MWPITYYSIGSKQKISEELLSKNAAVPASFLGGGKNAGWLKAARPGGGSEEGKRERGRVEVSSIPFFLIV